MSIFQDEPPYWQSDLNMGHGRDIPWHVYTAGDDPIVRASHELVTNLLDELGIDYEYRFGGGPSIVIKHGPRVSIMAYGCDGLEVFDSQTDHLFTIQYCDPTMIDVLKCYLMEGIRQ